jgi:hypothetical protein
MIFSFINNIEASLNSYKTMSFIEFVEGIERIANNVTYPRLGSYQA